MKAIEHVEYLLTQGKDPKELVELGFPKHVVTRVSRRLKKEKAAERVRAPNSERKGKALSETSAVSADNVVAIPEKLVFLESNLKAMQKRIGVLEAQNAQAVSVDDLNSRLKGTPVLGLKQRFKCDCGASGFVAVHIQCTKCGRESWWGWHPEK